MLYASYSKILKTTFVTSTVTCSRNELQLTNWACINHASNAALALGYDYPFLANNSNNNNNSESPFHAYKSIQATNVATY